MSRVQAFMLLGIFGVLVVAIALPLGAVAISLAATEDGLAGKAFDHGELFLAGANATLAGVVTYAASPTRHVLSRLITILFVVAFVTFPCYIAWGTLSAHAVLGSSYSRYFATTGGWVMMTVSTVIALIMVAAAVAPGRDAEALES